MRNIDITSRIESYEKQIKEIARIKNYMTERISQSWVVSKMEDIESQIEMSLNEISEEIKQGNESIKISSKLENFENIFEYDYRNLRKDIEEQFGENFISNADGYESKNKSYMDFLYEMDKDNVQTIFEKEFAKVVSEDGYYSKMDETIKNLVHDNKINSEMGEKIKKYIKTTSSPAKDVFKNINKYFTEDNIDSFKNPVDQISYLKEKIGMDLNQENKEIYIAVIDDISKIKEGVDKKLLYGELDNIIERENSKKQREQIMKKLEDDRNVMKGNESMKSKITEEIQEVKAGTKKAISTKVLETVESSIVVEQNPTEEEINEKNIIKNQLNDFDKWMKQNIQEDYEQDFKLLSEEEQKEYVELFNEETQSNIQINEEIKVSDLVNDYKTAQGNSNNKTKNKGNVRK